MRLQEHNKKFGRLSLLVPVMASIPFPVNAVSAAISSDGLTVSGGNLSDLPGVEQVFLSKGGYLINGITAVAAVVLVILFIKFVMDLAQSSDDPKGRKSAIIGVIGTLVAAAMIGGFSIFVNIGLGLFQ